jgi:hypothetical protein
MRVAKKSRRSELGRDFQWEESSLLHINKGNTYAITRCLKANYHSIDFTALSGEVRNDRPWEFCPFMLDKMSIVI